MPALDIQATAWPGHTSHAVPPVLGLQAEHTTAVSSTVLTVQH